MTATAPPAREPFPLRAFLIACLWVSLWVNASEVFRYFVVVRPALLENVFVAPDLAAEVAPIGWPALLVWTLWDTLLVILSVAMVWLCAGRFGPGRRGALVAGALSWSFFFLLFWVGMLNMNLASPSLLAIALPLSAAEMLLAALIADWALKPDRRGSAGAAEQSARGRRLESA